MKGKNIAITAIVGVATLGLAAIMLPSAAAYRGDYTVKGPNATPEREAAMTKVMESKDYAGWKALLTENGRNPGVLRVIDTQEEFNTFVEAWKLGKEGKTEEAAKLRAELGLGQGKGAGRSGMRGQNHGGQFVDANQNGTCDKME